MVWLIQEPTLDQLDYGTFVDGWPFWLFILVYNLGFWNHHQEWKHRALEAKLMFFAFVMCRLEWLEFKVSLGG